MTIPFDPQGLNTNGAPLARPKFSSGEIVDMQMRMRIKMQNVHLLEQAFIHRSYLNEARTSGLSSNERVEFLGDSVLELAVAQYLFRTYPDMTEGMMTAIKSSLVSGVMLGKLAEELHLGDFLRMSKGEATEFTRGGKSRKYILACTFEALLGALYLDRGLGIVELFLSDFLFPRIDDIVRQKLYLDYKSVLQEKAQGLLNVTPRYEVLSSSGPDHERTFVVGVYFDERLITQGEGSSKPEAERDAAKDALSKEFGIILNE